MARRRIGLQGGSFDPVHFGHLRAAEEVREQAGLDEIWQVLAARPPHKHTDIVTSVEHRRRMLELALSRAPGLRLCTIELERTGPSFTIDTIAALRERHADVDFTLLLGLDAFREIHSWHRAEELLGACDFAITSRPPDTVPTGLRNLSDLDLPIAVTGAFWYEEVQACFRHRNGRTLRFHSLTPLAISSSNLRERLRAGRSVRFLTDPDVIAYIEANGLYRA